MELKRTELYQNHVELGAKIVPFAGFEMPIQYASIKQEIISVRQNVGVFDVSHMGEFFVEGPDAIKFVDFLVTNDIENAEMNKAIYSPLCRNDGTIIDDLIVYKLKKDKILICVNASNIDKDWNHINSLSKNFECTITNQSMDYSLLAIQGPKSEEILLKIGVLSKSIDLAYYSVIEREWKDNHIIIARTGYTGEDGFEIFSSHSAAKLLWKLLINEKVEPCGLGARDVLRLEVAYPLYGHELHDLVTPFDCGLKWTVKMQKKNFIGKESLLDYKQKYELVKLSLDKGIPRSGHNVENTQGEVVGIVSSGTLSPLLNRGVALAHIEKDKIPKDKIFYIDIRNKKFLANYHQKAFLNGGHK